MAEEKKIPNPHGKLGGSEHRKKDEEVEKELKKKGFITRLEYFLRLFNGKGKFIDVVGLDKERNPKEYHQIGKMNKNGLPVKRERDTIEEIKKDKGIDIEFHPYNNQNE